MEGEALPAQTWERPSGREILEEQIAGNLPMPPIHYLTGMRPTTVGDGEASFAMPCHGLADKCDSAPYRVDSARCWPTPRWPPPSRPPPSLAPRTSRSISRSTSCARRTPTPRGATWWRTDGWSTAAAACGSRTPRCYNPEGKLIAVARGTSMLLPGQPAWAGLTS